MKIVSASIRRVDGCLNRNHKLICYQSWANIRFIIIKDNKSNKMTYIASLIQPELKLDFEKLLKCTKYENCGIFQIPVYRF